MNFLKGVKQTHRHDAIAAGVTLLVVMVGHALLETARDALFLEKLPPTQLPWTYLAIAIVAFGVARINRVLTRGTDKRSVLGWTLAALAVGTVGFWSLFGGHDPLVAHAFYVWTGVVASVAVVQFWLLLGDVFTLTEAKRLYAPIAAGGVVGAIGGSAAAELMLHWVGPRHLLLAGAAALMSAGFVPRMCGRADPHEGWSRTRTQPPSGAPALASSERPTSYVNRLLALTLISTVALTTVDYLFKTAVAETIAPQDYAAFFARFYLALNVLALIVQIGIAPKLLRLLGANRALIVLPAALLLGVAGVAALGGLLPLLALKAADGSLRHSIQRSAVEVLYLPLSRAVRDHCKGTIDALGQRGGQAVGSLAILGATALGARPIHLAVAVGAMTVAWIASSFGLKRLYLDLFRGHLRDGSIETKIDVPELDLHSLESMMSALNSERDEDVLATLDLLYAYDKVHLIPVLLLYHPSEPVVLRTIDLLLEEGRRDFVPVARRLLDHDDPEVRAAAMQALATLMPPDELRDVMRRTDTPVVRAAALVGLVARGADADGTLAGELADCVAGDDIEQKLAVARAIRLQGDGRFGSELVLLDDAREPSLQREVARAMGALADPRFLPHLIGMLATRAVRTDARDALEKIGPAALGALRDAIADSTLPRKVRVHVPRTISRFTTPQAARILLERQPRERDGLVRFKIIRALEKLRPVLLDPSIDRRGLLEDTRETVARAVRMLDWWLVTRDAQKADTRLATPGGDLLLAVIEEKVNNAVDRALRLASLLHPQEDFRVILLGLRGANRALRAESIELLEALLDPAYGPALVALVDDAPAEQRLQRASEAIAYEPGQSAYADRLRTMLQDGSEAVRCVAAYHIGELGWSELHGSLREARPDRAGYLSDIIDRTLHALRVDEPLNEPEHAT